MRAGLLALALLLVACASPQRELSLERSYQMPLNVAHPVPLFSVVRSALAERYGIDSEKPEAGALLTTAKQEPDGAVAFLVSIEELSSDPVRRAGMLHAAMRITVKIALNGRETPIDAAPAHVQTEANAFLAFVAQSVKGYEAPVWPERAHGLP